MIMNSLTSCFKKLTGKNSGEKNGYRNVSKINKRKTSMTKVTDSKVMDEN